MSATQTTQDRNLSHTSSEPRKASLAMNTIPPQIPPNGNLPLIYLQDKHPKFPIYNMNEILRMPDPVYLVEKLIMLQGLTCFYGPSTVGKTFYALHIALEVALTHNVLYIAAEGQLGYKKRIQVWCKQHNVDPQSLHFYRCDKAVRMLDRGDVGEFIDLVKQFNPSLVVIDTVARSMVGGDENGSKDMTLFLDACQRMIDELKTAVLAIHHTGKNTTAGLRGHSSFQGACDITIELKRNEPCTDIIEVVCTKSKDDEPNETTYFQLEQIFLDDQINSCVIVPVEKPQKGKNAEKDEKLTGKKKLTPKDKILKVLQESPTKEMKQNEIADKVGITSKALYPHLNSLKASEYIIQDKHGGPYKVTEKGRSS